MALPAHNPPPMTLGDNLYESVSLSLTNMLRGDPEASVRALLASRTLSPQEHTRLHAEVTGDQPGLINGMLRAVTNPLVLVGAAASMKWPVTNLAKLTKVGQSLVKYDKWVPAPLRQLLGLNETFFGTPIPRLFNRIAADSNNFLERNFIQLGTAFEKWKGVVGRAPTARDQVRWAMLADSKWWSTPEGLKPLNAAIGKANRALARSGKVDRLPTLTPSMFRVQAIPGDEIILGAHQRVMEGVRAELSTDPERLKRMGTFLYREKGVGRSPSEAIKWVEGGFFPHVGLRDQERLRRLQQEFTRDLLEGSPRGTGAGAVSRGVSRPQGPSPGRLTRRTGVLPPDADDLKLLQGAVDPDALKALDGVRAWRLGREQLPTAARVGSYSMRYADAVTSYAHSVSRSFAWNNTPAGEAIHTGGRLLQEAKNVLNTELALSPNRGLAKADLLRSVYIPMALGRPSHQQAMKALEWGGIRQATWRMLDDPKVTSLLPQGVVTRFRDMMAESGGLGGARGAGSRIAEWFYLSTLGGGIGPASQNLLQPLLTTAPVIGLSNTVRGMASVIGKIPQFLRYRREGLNVRGAMAKVWPEFEARQLDLSPAFTEMMEGARPESLLKGAVRGGWDKAKDALMAPFRSSEIFNRLSTFEGSRLFAKRAGLPPSQVDDLAQELTQVTQLWAGPSALPAFMQEWNPALRQFLSFPAKLAGFVGASALNLGGPFNWGTLGRAMAYSAGAYELVKGTTGEDISHSLLFGALPTPEEGGPFAPLPVVPPVLGLAGALGMDLVGGEGFPETRKELPLLVPGGLVAARFAQLESPEVAQFLGRGFADKGNRLPDGRIPMYSPSGTFVGGKTDWQLYANSLGGLPGKLLGPSGEANEQSLLQYLLTNREKMVELRRSYMEATLENDFTTAESARVEYFQRFGHPLEVRPQDLEALQSRMETPRLDRILQTLPAAARPRYSAIAAAALTGQGRRFVGVDPLLLSGDRGVSPPTTYADIVGQ